MTTMTATPGDLARCALLTSLDAATAAALLRSCVTLEVRAGDVVFAEGQLGSSYLLVEDGVLKLVRAGRRARGRLTSVLGPGDLAWHVTDPSSGRRVTTAVAATDCRLLEISAAQVQRWQVEHPVVSLDLLRLASAGLREADDTISTMWACSAPTRATRALVTLARRLGRPVAGRQGHLSVEHGLTQAELSELAGVRRETLNKRLAELAQSGLLLTRRGAFEVTDVEQLAACAAR